MTHLLLAGFLLLATGFVALLLLIVFVKLSSGSSLLFWRQPSSTAEQSPETRASTGSANVSGFDDGSPQQVASLGHIESKFTKNDRNPEVSTRRLGMQWRIAREADVVLDENRESQAEFVDGEGNVREGPGTDYQVLFTPSRGTTGTMIGSSGQWTLIELDNGQVGWTHKKNLRGIPTPQGQEPDLECGNCVLKNEADLNGDGEPEDLLLRPYKREYSECLDFSLAVYKQGKLVWEAPQDEIFFGYTPLLVDDLSIIADLDQDGRDEILVGRSCCDPSPDVHSVLGWDGEKIVTWKEGAFYLDRSLRTLSFVQEVPLETNVPFVTGLEKTERNGLLKAYINQSYDPLRRSEFPRFPEYGRSALVRFVRNGLKVEEWLEQESP